MLLPALQRLPTRSEEVFRDTGRALARGPWNLERPRQSGPPGGKGERGCTGLPARLDEWGADRPAMQARRDAAAVTDAIDIGAAAADYAAQQRDGKTEFGEDARVTHP
ncbi:hypothetical protein [Cupriavidus sp. TA19]|uniref:hypothetical protein n=1 Tax=Cupriavidus sp. TA19 TaxID=701108 RepID=UPI00295E62E1|nr:hypothetical protein [Cupriavidus sp. TA19]